MINNFLHITGNINFFIIDIKNNIDPSVETIIKSIHKKNYNFGIILNNTNNLYFKEVLQIPCFSIRNEENYYALDIFQNETNVLKYKFIFINLLKLFKNKLDNFFIWFENQLNDNLDVYDTVFIISNNNPFSILQMDMSNEYLIKFLNIVIKHKNHNKFVFLTSYNEDQYSEYLSMHIWHKFNNKIKIININPLNVNKSYEFILPPKDKKRNGLVNEANFYFNKISYSYMEITIDPIINFILNKQYVVSLANVINFIINQMIKIAKDIKLNGFSEKKKNIFEWYNSNMIEYGYFTSYEKIIKNNKLLHNVLRKNFLINAVREVNKYNIEIKGIEI